MLLVSLHGLKDRIGSTVLIGVTTQNGVYAKSFLQGRLKYLSITEVDFHRSTVTESTHYPQVFDNNESHSLKRHIDYSLQAQRQSMIATQCFSSICILVVNIKSLVFGILSSGGL